jgi:hypothetical protein
MAFLSNCPQSIVRPALICVVCLSVQSATGVTCTMACMSRAGREPGFKKQNQDNCFAFEKYITNEQSLFGAFDGHGPNGRRCPPLHCSKKRLRENCLKTTLWRILLERALFDCCACGALPLSGADLSVGESWPSRMV